MVVENEGESDLLGHHGLVRMLRGGLPGKAGGKRSGVAIDGSVVSSYRQPATASLIQFPWYRNILRFEGVEFDFAEEGGRVFGGDGIDVEAGAPLETRRLASSWG